MKLKYRFITSLRLYRIFEPFFQFFQFRKHNRHQRSQKILVIRLDQIGDIILTIPFLRELRRSFINARITLIVKPEVFNLVELCPYVDEVITFRNRRFFPIFYFCIKHLWKHQFDAAVLPRCAPDPISKLLSYISGSSERIGYSEQSYFKQNDEFSEYDRFLTTCLKTAIPKHQVEHALELLAVIGGKAIDKHLETWITDEENEEAVGEMKGNLWIAFSPGARHRRRCWPLKHYCALGRWLIENFSAKIVVLGSSNDKLMGGEFERELKGKVLNKIGFTSLRQAAARLKRCRLFIGNDSGLMHLAAAQGVPVLEISAYPQSGDFKSDMSPKIFGPWGVSCQILQPLNPTPPCRQSCSADEPHCINAISLDDVKRSAVLLLKDQSF